MKIFIAKESLYRLGLCILVGLGVRLGYGPWDSHLWGLLAPLSFLVLAGSLNGNWKAALVWAIALPLVVHGMAFFWMLAGLQNIGHMSFLSAAFFFLVSALLVQAKLGVFLLAAQLLRPLGRSPWGLAALAVLSDAVGSFLFPWHWGNLAAGSDAFRQAASLPGGVHLLSFLFFLEAWLLWRLLLFATHLIRKYTSPKPGSAGKKNKKESKEKPVYFSVSLRTRLEIALALCLLAGAWIWGSLRLQTPDKYQKKITVVLVQPALPAALQKYKGDGAYAGLALNRFFGLGLRALVSEPRPDLLIYPESAVPFYTTRKHKAGRHGGPVYSPTFHAIVAMLSRLGKVDVIYNELEPAPSGYFNSASVFSFSKARPLAAYRKRQLIPFGEYLPKEDALPFLRQLFPEVSRYQAGDVARFLAYRIYESKGEALHIRPEVLQKLLLELKDPKLVLRHWPGLSGEKPTPSKKDPLLQKEAPVSHYILPLICYEGTFPALTKSFFLEAAKRPDFLINLSNDVWFGSKQEIYQHALAARLRAVETGRYLLRANMSGYSAIYDTKGRLRAGPLPIAKPGILLAEVPLLPNAKTLYLEYASLPFFFLLLLLFFMDFFRNREIPPRKRG